MKKIFAIGEIQHFKYKSLFYRITKRTTSHWICRNVKYIWASSEEEATKKYKELYFVGYKGVEDCDKWEAWSDKVSTKMRNSRVVNTSSEIALVDAGVITYHELVSNMSADDFKEWWKADNYADTSSKPCDCTGKDGVITSSQEDDGSLLSKKVEDFIDGIMPEVTPAVFADGVDSVDSKGDSVDVSAQTYSSVEDKDSCEVIAEGLLSIGVSY